MTLLHQPAAGDFVLDASVALANLLKDEVTPALAHWFDGLLDNGRALIPHHWWNEVANGLCMALRRGRINEQEATSLLDVADIWNPLMVDEPGSTGSSAALSLAQAHDLTVYDGLYLRIAVAAHLPVASFDGKLIRAASALGLPVLVPPAKVKP